MKNILRTTQEYSKNCKPLYESSNRYSSSGIAQKLNDLTKLIAKKKQVTQLTNRYYYSHTFTGLVRDCRNSHFHTKTLIYFMKIGTICTTFDRQVLNYSHAIFNRHLSLPSGHRSRLRLTHINAIYWNLWNLNVCSQNDTVYRNVLYP